MMRKFSDATKSEFLTIVERYYAGDFTPMNITDASEMTDFAVLHQLNALYYSMLLNGKYDIVDATTKIKYLSSIQVNLTIGNEGDKLSSYLRSEGIPHAFFKGHYIKDFYDPRGVRSMGDIDVYIDRSHMDSVRSYFTANGYSEDGYYDEVYHFKRGFVEFEVHNAINWFGIDWAEGEEIEGNRFSTTTETAMTIIHTMKHIVGFGCGIRQILDVAILLREDNQVLSNEKFLSDIDSIKISKCYNTLIGLINRWFGESYPCEADERAIDILESAVLDGGVFGKNLNDYATINTVQQQSRFKMYWRMLFPPYERMVLSYPKLEGRRYLLLHYYMVRLFTRGLKEKRYRIISANGASDEQIDSRQLFMDELELRDQYYNKI